MRVLDLFSGIGGFSLGLESSGPFRTVAFCEQEQYCQAVLRKHWPDTPIYDDVRTIDADGLGRVDIIAGGFPCQPWSQAGQQRGAEDDRDLWPAMASLIEKLQPQWVIGENVRGFVNEPLGLQRSLSDLARIGYSAIPFVIPACAVDAPHRRDRVWIVAHRTGLGRQAGSAPAGWQERDGVIGFECAADVADADSERSQRVGANSNPKGREKSTQRPAGLCDGTTGAKRWATEPDVGRVAHGISRRVDRLRALGNAVIPAVVAQIGRAILQAECAR